MSYIGKNPKADSLKLTSTSTAASGTDEGQVYYNDGTGTISEGLKVYKNGNFVGIDKQLGDADTIALKKAVDVGGLQWAVAINSTGATVGMNAPVPQYDATATGFIAASTFSNTSTGNALLTDESADLVFAYESHATNSKNDYWGIQVDIPKAFRGGNLVLSFEYRTEEASGATSDDDFRFSVQDNTTANRGQTIGGTGVTGSQAAGTSILVGSSSNFSVGDSVRVESGTGIQGAQANDFTEAYVTAIADATHLTFSQTIVFPSTVGALIAGGWLTPMVGGQLAEADSDTNKVGKKRSIQFKTLETTETVNVTFQNLSTSAAGIDLFVDNILLSANKFLQASSQGLPETAFFSGDAGHYSTYTPYFTTEHINTVDKVGTFQNGSSTTYTYFEAKVRCLVSCNFWYYNDGVGGGYSALIKNDLSSTNPEAVSLDSKRVAFAYAADFRAQECSVSIVLEKGDTLRPASEDGNASATLNGLHLTATPLVNDVIILESQDEIFTDWVDYTPTYNGLGTVTTKKAAWRRVGPNMEIMAQFTTGSPTADTAYFTIPSGYSLRSMSTDNISVECGRWLTAAADSYSRYLVFRNTAGSEDWIYFTYNSGSYNAMDARNGNQIFGTENVSAILTVPIQGWNSNFNPLLSMPLVDFGTFENTYSARIANNGTASITSQSQNFISGVNRDSQGAVTITFVSGFFTIAPSIEGSVIAATNAAVRSLEVVSATTTTAVINTGYAQSTANSLYDYDFFISAARQGSDYKQPPQPTAAVIKPAVAILKDVKAYNVDGGTSTSGAFRSRDLNTVEGESWFVTLADPDFTLDPGTYKINATVPFYYSNYCGARLYDVTNSAVVKYSAQGYSLTAQNSSFIDTVLTIGASTAFRIQYRTSGSRGTDGLGLSQYTDSAAVAVYTTVRIEKLK